MLVEQLPGELLNAGDDLDRGIEHVAIGAMQPRHVLERIGPGSLLLVPGDRADVIHATIAANRRQKILDREPGLLDRLRNRSRFGRQASEPGQIELAGMVFTGGYRPEARELEAIRQSGLFALLVEHGHLPGGVRGPRPAGQDAPRRPGEDRGDPPPGRRALRRRPAAGAAGLVARAAIGRWGRVGGQSGAGAGAKRRQPAANGVLTRSICAAEPRGSMSYPGATPMRCSCSSACRRARARRGPRRAAQSASIRPIDPAGLGCGSDAARREPNDLCPSVSAGRRGARRSRAARGRRRQPAPSASSTRRGWRCRSDAQPPGSVYWNTYPCAGRMSGKPAAASSRCRRARSTSSGCLSSCARVRWATRHQADD